MAASKIYLSIHRTHRHLEILTARTKDEVTWQAKFSFISWSIRYLKLTTVAHNSLFLLLLKIKYRNLHKNKEKSPFFNISLTLKYLNESAKFKIKDFFLGMTNRLPRSSWSASEIPFPFKILHYRYMPRSWWAPQTKFLEIL